MAQLSGFYTRGFRCDGHRCTEEISGELMPNVSYYVRIGAEKGWTFWRSRSLRSYCPNHGPSKNHQMWPVKPW